MITNLLSPPPCWWYLVTIILLFFHCVRGLLGQWYLNQNKRKVKGIGAGWVFNMTQVIARIWVFYLHDVLLHFTCTVFGTVCFLVAINIPLSNISQLNPGGALLLVSSSLLGLAGITGQLAVMLSLGRMPGMR